MQWKFVIKYTEKVDKYRRTTEVTKHDRQNTFSIIDLLTERTR